MMDRLHRLDFDSRLVSLTSVIAGYEPRSCKGSLNLITRCQILVVWLLLVELVVQALLVEQVVEELPQPQVVVSQQDLLHPHTPFMWWNTGSRC